MCRCEEQIRRLIGSSGGNTKQSWTSAWLGKLTPFAINFLAVRASWELSVPTGHQAVGLEFGYRVCGSPLF